MIFRQEGSESKADVVVSKESLLVFTGYCGKDDDSSLFSEFVKKSASF